MRSTAPATFRKARRRRWKAKRAVFAELDRLAAPDAILASSTSTIVASRFTETLKAATAAWSPTR